MVETGSNVLQYLHKRHHNDIQTIGRNVEHDHQRFMDGVNRNLNMEAIQIRIQIEEATLGRPLEEFEKNKIIESQLSKPAMAKGNRREEVKEEVKGGGGGDSSGSYYSSDENDWADPDYIEE